MSVCVGVFTHCHWVHSVGTHSRAQHALEAIHFEIIAKFTLNEKLDLIDLMNHRIEFRVSNWFARHHRPRSVQTVSRCPLVRVLSSVFCVYFECVCSSDRMPVSVCDTLCMCEYVCKCLFVCKSTHIFPRRFNKKAKTHLSAAFQQQKRPTYNNQATTTTNNCE